MGSKICIIIGLLTIKIQNEHSLSREPKMRLTSFLIMVFTDVMIVFPASFVETG